MKILVTGAAGFIGFHVARRLLEAGHEVLGLDNVNDYYGPELKESRLEILQAFAEFKFYRSDLVNKAYIEEIFKTNDVHVVIHLAAQAGVRYSITNPDVYISSNIVGFFNVLEAIRAHPVKHFIYASSSSVYGGNKKVPFSEEDKVDQPISLYAATKKSNELMAHTYAHLYGIPSTGLRFFTVFGPWGRPDMALYKFAEKISNDEEIEIFNNGEMTRDFTYIDDVVESVNRLIPEVPAKEDEAGDHLVPHNIYNIGSNHPVNLLRYIESLEKAMGKTARKKFMPIQPGDVKDTYADVSPLVAKIKYSPSTPIDRGIDEFVKWFKEYKQVSPLRKETKGKNFLKV